MSADKSLRRLHAAVFVVLFAVVSGCTGLHRPAGIGEAVPWSDLRGFDDDRLANAWPALLNTCAVRAQDPVWAQLCAQARALDPPDDAQARAFFRRYFVPHAVYADGGGVTGLITGYYEPVLNGSLKRTRRFRYPVYGRPSNLLKIDLSSLYPELRGKVLRGRVTGDRVVPYYSRAEIDARGAPLKGREILWVDDPVGLFFLQIQGSGKVVLPDGSRMEVAYADQNGHPYVPLGRCLSDRGVLPPGADIDLFTIKAALAAHPERRNDLLNCNPSYIFFRLLPDNGPAQGALKVPLTPRRSIAVDSAYIPLGLPVWLDTSWPVGAQPLRRLVFAQDRGGAIKGPVRADLYFGEGDVAERWAGTMKQLGRVFVLVPAGDNGSPK